MKMIRFENFEKWYGKRRVVRSLDLTINRGETFAFLGPNGGGKTTILRALVGLHFPTKGRILVKDIDVVRQPVQAKRLISYLPQRVTAPDRLTAREVLETHAELRHVEQARVDEIICSLALEEDADRDLGVFSGGMLQRLGLGIALLSRAEILVLDEPTLNLDPLGVERFRALMDDMKSRGVTVLLSSHLMQDADRLADRVGILVEGELVKTESVEDFRRDLSHETSVRVVLNRADNGILSAAQSAGALQTVQTEQSLTFKAHPDRRLTIIRAIEDAGAKVIEFHTDPPNWEAMVGRHFKSKDSQNHE